MNHAPPAVKLKKGVLQLMLDQVSFWKNKLKGLPARDCCTPHPLVDLVCFGMTMNVELPQTQWICGEEAHELGLATALPAGLFQKNWLKLAYQLL